MPLRNILSKELITCKPVTSVRDVAKLMKEKEVGAVLVIEEKRPVGIITDRDLTLRCLAESKDISFMTAENVMSVAVETVSDDDGIYDVIQKMRRAWVRRVPVVNAMGEAVGLLSFDDMFELIADEVGAMKEVIRPREPKIVEQAA